MPLILRISFLISAALFAFTISFSVIYHLPLPFSDAMGAIFRVIQKINGTMGWEQFLFQKHGEHFHAGIYMMLYLDTVSFSSKLYLPLILGFISNIFFFGMLCYLVLRTTHNHKLQAALILFAALMIASLANAETWTLAFQAVVTTFRATVILCITLYAYGLAWKSQKLITTALFLSSISLFLHGGGILLPILLSISALVQARWRYSLLPFTLYIIFFFVNNWSDSLRPQTGLSEMALTLMQENIFMLLLSTASNTAIHLGLQMGGSFGAPIIGWLGMCAGAITLIMLATKRRALSTHDSIWVSLMAFSFISGALASLLLVVGIHNHTRDAGVIYSGRYVAIAGIYWISLAALLLPRLHSKIALTTAIALCMIAGISFAKSYSNANANAAFLQTNMNLAVQQAKMGPISKESALFLFQPSKQIQKVDAVIAFYRTHQLNIFHD